MQGGCVLEEGLEVTFQGIQKGIIHPETILGLATFA